MNINDCSLVPVTWGRKPATATELIEIAIHAEELGFYSVGLPHTPVLLHQEDSPPPPPHWRFIPREYRDWYMDSLVLLPMIVQATSRIRIALNVFLAAWLHPFISAKYLASLDVASGGRIISGFGLGYAPPGGRCTSFDNLGIDSRRRASMGDEALAAIVKLWTSTEPVSFTGRHFTGVELAVEPKPVQQPYPETWWAGQAETSIVRAARYARYLELHRVSAASVSGHYVEGLAKANAEYGGKAKLAMYLYGNILGDRDFSAFELSKHFWDWDVEEVGLLAAGGPEQCARVLQTYRDAGVDHFVFDLHRHGQDHVTLLHDQMEKLAKQVIPLVR